MCYTYKGEILNNTFGWISTPIDEVHYVKESFMKSTIKSFFSGTPLKFVDSLDKHSMRTVIELLE